jgi:hypothetical protein
MKIVRKLAEGFSVSRKHYRSKVMFFFLFKEMIPKNKESMNNRWDCFENATTKSYARSVVQKGFALNSG